MSLYVIIILIRGQIWRDLILFLQDLQSNLCECQRLSRGDVVDYAPLTKLNEPFAATNTPRAHTTLTKEDEHVNLFCMHWEGSVHLLACKRAHQYSKPTRSSRTPSPRTCPLTSPPPWTPLHGREVREVRVNDQASPPARRTSRVLAAFPATRATPARAVHA